MTQEWVDNDDLVNQGHAWRFVIASTTSKNTQKKALVIVDTKSLLITFVGLLKQKIGRQLFVLVTRKIGLNHRVAGKSKTAEL
jgi:hypothetical protein